MPDGAGQKLAAQIQIDVVDAATEWIVDKAIGSTPIAQAGLNFIHIHIVSTLGNVP